MIVKTGLLYAKSHEWIRVEGDEAVVGITDYAQGQLGDLTYVGLPEVGGNVAAGQEIGSVESVKAASEIYSPANGEIIAVNEALDAAPEKINQSPYDEGWMARLRLSAQPSGLMDAQAYTAYVSGGAS